MEIRRTYNPLTLNYDVIYSGTDLLSPNQVIERENLIFVRPVVLLVNGEPILREFWGNKLKKDDICHFVELPGDPITVAIFIGQMIIMAVVAYAVGYLYNLWFGPEPVDTVEDAETVYSLTNDVNRFRIGDPFPEHFGRFICFPSLMQQNYVEYASHDCQYLYMLGIVGVGEYDVEGVYIDKTPIGDYEDCSYNIIVPSGSPTMIPRLVYTSPAITGQELTTNWLTVAVTAPNVEVTEIGFDIVLPGGLGYYTKTGGDFKTYHVSFEAQVRKIDEFGDGLTGWVDLKSVQLGNAIATPLRYTYKCSAMGAARYEFRIRRTDIPSTLARVIDNCKIGALRGYGADHPDYGDVTLLEVKIKATERLSGSVARKINCIATRKLYPVTVTGFGGVKAATKSIVDACAYIATADNGGQQLDSVLDFEELFAMRTTLESRSNYFSHRFTKKTMCMDALRQIAKCGRCLPIQPSGLFQLVRDRLQSSPSQIYTCDDYTKGTLQFQHAMRTDDDSTGVEAEYIDDETWQVQTVLCYDAGGSADNLARLPLTGCCDRQHAFEEGMYAFWDDELNRTVVSFAAGLKGLIPAIGDMIYVGSRQIDWGQTGQIAHISATVATLSEPVDFGDTALEGKLLLTKKDGGVLGPYTVAPGDCAHSVGVTLSPADVNTIHDQGLTATKFIFGLTIDEILRVRVLKIIPTSNNEIKIEGSIIHDEVHDNPGTAPAIGTFPIILPILDNLIITLVATNPSDYDYQACWLSGESKFKLEIDTGGGYVLLVDNLEAYTYDFTRASIDFDIKITPYIADVLTPTESKIVSFELPAAPSNIQAIDDGTDLTISWDAVPDADYYNLRIECDGEDIWDEGIYGVEKVISISELIDLANDVTPEIDIYIKTTIDGLVGPESMAVSWSSGFEAEDASTIFMCKSFNDSAVSGTPLLIRFQNQNFDYFYFKAYPTIGAEVGGTSDDAGSDFRGAVDSALSGTPRIGKIESGGTSYYYKQYPTVAADVESFSGITKNIINIGDLSLSGIPRAARIQINSTNYYFKVYPTKS